MGVVQLIGLLIVGGIAALSILYYAMLIPSIWQGDRVPEPRGGRRKIKINKRNWPVTGTGFLFLALGIGAMFITDWAGLFSEPGQTVGMGLAFFGVFLLLVGMVIDAFNRPKFLVPPPHRDENGWAVQRWKGTDDGSDQGMDGHDVDNGNELEFDFTNEEVQQWLRSEGGVEQIEEWVEDDLAQVVYEGETESHYAVLDPWWGEIAKDVVSVEPDDDEFSEFLVSVGMTSAYQDHSDRVGEYPDIGGGIGTSPFVVEHRSESTEDVLNERTESQLLED